MESSSDPKDQNVGRSPRGRWAKLLAAGVDRLIELIFALAVVVFAGLQWWTSYSNNKSSGQQTDQLIAAAKVSTYAANQNVAAAQSFADSAKSINAGISRAVGQLQAEADATENARQSAEGANARAIQTTVDNARADLRAYIVTTMFRDDVRMGMGCVGHNNEKCVNFQYQNVGKTPAVAVKVTAFLKLDNPIGGEGNYLPAMKQLASNDSYTGLEGSVLGTNIPTTGTTQEVGGPTMIPCKQGYHSSPCGHAIYGLIQYKDIFDKIHETGFCLYFVDDGPNRSGRSCVHGNWFDVRPSFEY